MGVYNKEKTNLPHPIKGAATKRGRGIDVFLMLVCFSMSRDKMYVPD